MRTQGRTQEFFLQGGGGSLSTIDGTGKRGREAGGGGPTRGNFCIFEIEIERSGAHFGWIFWKFFKKEENTYNDIHEKFVFLRLG